MRASTHQGTASFLNNVRLPDNREGRDYVPFETNREVRVT